MALDLSGINAMDRSDFERRIGRYGLKADTASFASDHLRVAPNVKTLLTSGVKEPSAFRPIMLQAGDIDLVKKWVGLPDKLFDNPQVSRPTIGQGFLPAGMRHEPNDGKSHPAASAALAAFDRKNLTSAQSDVLRSAARTYVRGVSADAKAFKPVLDRFIGDVLLPLWLFNTIHIAKGAVLEFGPGQNILVAYRLEIEQGGVVRTRGSLSVNCTIVRRS